MASQASRKLWVGTAGLLVTLALATACQGPTGQSDDMAVETPDANPEATSEATPEASETMAAAEPVLEDAPSPVGGSVKQLVVPGPETSVLFACDQEGFEPFFYTDQGDWVGCQISDGGQPGAESTMTEPTIEDVPSPVGGMVKQVTIPGPSMAVLLACKEEGFNPFTFIDQGFWIGCESQ
jgi:hypothetical protein